MFIKKPKFPSQIENNNKNIKNTKHALILKINAGIFFRVRS